MAFQLPCISWVLLSVSWVGHCAYYNQQQHGGVNYQIDLQDVVVVALLDDLGGDYNYDYDYSDLTVKPEQEETTSGILIPPSTPSPPTENSTLFTALNATHLENKPTTNATPLHLQSNATEESSVPADDLEDLITAERFNASDVGTTTQKPPIKIPVKEPEHPLNTHNFQIPVMVITEASKLKKGYVSSSTIRRKNTEHSAAETEVLPKRTCKHGFFLDDRNRCKKINRKHNHSRSRPQLPFGLRYAQRPTEKPADDDLPDLK